MLKKLKNSFIFICLISLLTGCVNQNQEVQTNEEVTIAIIGPKTMEYERVISLLEFIKDNIEG